MSKTGSSWWRHMLAGGRNNEHWTSSKKRENVPPLHCDGVPYVTLVNADEDIMLMLLVIMLSFYFCEICGNFPQTVTNHTCPLYTGTQWSTISATRIIRCQVSFISPHTLPSSPVRRSSAEEEAAVAAQRVKLQNYMKQELEHQSKCSICWQVCW